VRAYRPRQTERSRNFECDRVGCQSVLGLPVWLDGTMAGATHDHSDFHRGEWGVCRNNKPASNRFSCAASEGGRAPSGTSLGLAGLDGPGDRPRPIQACRGAGCGPWRTQPNDRSRPKRRTILSTYGCSSERRDHDRRRGTPPEFAHPDLWPNEKLQPGALTPGFLENRTRPRHKAAAGVSAPGWQECS